MSGGAPEPPVGIPADPELEAAGWERRFLADEARAEEALETYRELGFEVMAVELTPSTLGPKCGSCAATICSAYVLIYTRRPGERP